MAVVSLAVIGLAGLGCDTKLSEDVARRVAEERFTSYCSEFSIDRDLLAGPQRIRPSDPGFVFEWATFDAAEPVAIEVWVSDSGTAEVGVGRGIERLEGTQQSKTTAD